MKKLLLLIILAVAAQVVIAQTSPQFGLASVYADVFDGQKTASGVPYDKDKYTGSHNSLPYGTLVKVTRLDSMLSVNVTINDRGSFVEGHLIDLSRRAASVIRLSPGQKANVKLEVLRLGNGEKVAEGGTSTNTKPSADKAEVAKADPPKKSSNNNTVEKTEAKTTAKPKPNSTIANLPTAGKKSSDVDSKVSSYDKVANSSKQPVNTAEAGAIPATLYEKDKSDEYPLLQTKNYSEYGLYKVKVMKPESKGYGVQVAYLTDYKNVLKQVAKLQDNWFENILVSVEKNKLNTTVYKIVLGPFDDQATAEAYEGNLKRKHKIDGFVINLEEIKY